MSRTASRSVSSASIPLDASETLEKPDEATAEKTAQIMSACHDRHLRALIDLATTKHGLVNDSLRRTACMHLLSHCPLPSLTPAGPILLGCRETNKGSEASPPWDSLSPHRDEEQVAKDVNRAFVNYPRGTTHQDV